MTPTEKARRSDSLYYGEVSRRTLCDMVAEREDRIGRLELELRDACGDPNDERGAVGRPARR